MASIKKTCENMKITILPDITDNAGLNGQKFDAALEPEVKSWFQQVESIWKSCMQFDIFCLHEKSFKFVLLNCRQTWSNFNACTFFVFRQLFKSIFIFAKVVCELQ